MEQQLGTGGRHVYDPAQWGKTDEEAEKGAFVSFLDARSSSDHETARREKRLALLSPHQGNTILDVGCGLGEDVRAIAHIVGDTGRVVGVDHSGTMIAEARKRTEGLGLPVEFQVGNIYALNFSENTFDSCQAVRTFVHLEEPGRALAEMVRVAHPEGRIVVADADFETLIVNAPNRALTRKILHFQCDSLRNPWMGRQLLGLMRQVGLRDISIEAFVSVCTDHADPGNPDLNLDTLNGLAQRAREAGVVSAAEASAWLGSLDEAGLAGRYFVSITAFYVAGRKP